MSYEWEPTPVRDVDYNPDGVRSPYPQVYPQYPYDTPPESRELSLPTYGILEERATRITMRDGVRLAADVFRPAGTDQPMPALIGVGPYTRQFQDTNVALGHNEAGIKEFWVPRGYAMILVDVRGTNDSEGSWDMFGPTEQQDTVDLIAWAAQQPWCDGNVGTVGASYYARSALMAAGHRPPALKAVFAYDAATDAYRDTFFKGGIPNDQMHRWWFTQVAMLNHESGRLEDPSGIQEHLKNIRGLEYPLDGEYYQQRSSWPLLDQVEVPTYFVCRWSFWNLHLRGAPDGWQLTGDIPKRMLIGPDPKPNRPMASYHMEALRWYDYWLKGMDTGVMDGPPIRLWQRGQGGWQAVEDWPLPNTDWTDYYLAGSADGDDGELGPQPEAQGTRHSYDIDPTTAAWMRGQPRLVYRTPAMEHPLEITGPIQLDLWLESTAADTDVFVTLADEAPTGEFRQLTRGWLRASHRAVDATRSLPNKPWHPHTDVEPLTPGTPTLLQVEIVPTSNVFQQGHRIRLEISSSEDATAGNAYHRALPQAASNSVLQGGEHASKINLPVIPH